MNVNVPVISELAFPLNVPLAQAHIITCKQIIIIRANFHIMNLRFMNLAIFFNQFVTFWVLVDKLVSVCRLEIISWSFQHIKLLERFLTNLLQHPPFEFLLISQAWGFGRFFFAHNFWSNFFEWKKNLPLILHVILGTDCHL